MQKDLPSESLIGWSFSGQFDEGPCITKAQVDDSPMIQSVRRHSTDLHHHVACLRHKDMVLVQRGAVAFGTGWQVAGVAAEG